MRVETFTVRTKEKERLETPEYTLKWMFVCESLELIEWAENRMFHL
jgi:hypothetical protein